MVIAVVVVRTAILMIPIFETKRMAIIFKRAIPKNDSNDNSHHDDYVSATLQTTVFICQIMTAPPSAAPPRALPRSGFVVRIKSDRFYCLDCF